MNERLTPALIHYLFGISEILKTKQVARVRDIAEFCGVKGASVCSAMSRLARLGYVHYQTGEYITLTGMGIAKARVLEERRQLAQRFLVEQIRMNASQAGKEAQSLALCLSEEAFRLIRHHLDLVDDAPISTPLSHSSLDLK